MVSSFRSQYSIVAGIIFFFNSNLPTGSNVNLFQCFTFLLSPWRSIWYQNRHVKETVIAKGLAETNAIIKKLKKHNKHTELVFENNINVEKSAVKKPAIVTKPASLKIAMAESNKNGGPPHRYSNQQASLLWQISYGRFVHIDVLFEYQFSMPVVLF